MTKKRGSLAARTTLAGVAATAGLATAAVSALLHQGKLAAGLIETNAVRAARRDGLLRDEDSVCEGAEAHRWTVPRADGIYRPDGSLTQSDLGERPLVLAMMGDSLAVGYGCRTSDELPGVRLARGIAAAENRPVRLTTHGLVGAGSADLPRQLRETLPEGPDLIVLVIGANDIRDKVWPLLSASRLRETVAALRGQQIPVVVPTCPDYGVITPIPMPLRAVLHRWSVLLAALQNRAVGTAGGRSVALGKLMGPLFAADTAMFFGDGFHPSGYGYGRTVATILPVALQALHEDRLSAPPSPTASMPPVASRTA